MDTGHPPAPGNAHPPLVELCHSDLSNEPPPPGPWPPLVRVHSKDQGCVVPRNCPPLPSVGTIAPPLIGPWQPLGQIRSKHPASIAMQRGHLCRPPVPPIRAVWDSLVVGCSQIMAFFQQIFHPLRVLLEGGSKSMLRKLGNEAK